MSNHNTLKYTHYNFHPLQHIDKIQAWLQQTETYQPLVLRGMTGIGKEYLLEAACYQQTFNKLPTLVFTIDNNMLDGDFQNRVNIIEPQIKTTEKESSEWKKLTSQLAETVDIETAEGATVTLNLAIATKLIKLFSKALIKKKHSRKANTSKQQIQDSLELASKKYNLVVHLQNMQSAPFDLGMWQDITQTLDESSKESGMKGRVLLAVSLAENTNFSALLQREEEQLRLIDLKPYTASGLELLFKQRFSPNNFTQPFLDLLLWQGLDEHQLAITPSQLDYSFTKLIEKKLLQQKNDVWQLDLNALASMNTVLGLPLRDYYQQRFETLPKALQPIIKEYMYLASLCGQWIPQQELLEAMDIVDQDQQGDILDAIEIAFIEDNKPLLKDHAYTHPSFPEIAVYELLYPLLKFKIQQYFSYSEVQKRTKAKDLLDKLRYKLTLKHQVTADLLWNLALKVDKQTQNNLEQYLHWYLRPSAMPYFKKWLGNQLEQYSLTVEYVLKQAAKTPITPSTLYYIDAVIETCEEYLQERGGFPLTERMAESLRATGVIYRLLGDYNKALKYLQKALMIIQGIKSIDHFDTATYLNSIGVVYIILGDHTKALQYQKKALVIWQKVLGEDHPDTATSLNNIGATYEDLGDHAKSLQYQEKALAIWQKVLGEDHPDTASSLNNIGATYGEFGDHAKALQYLEKALAIRQKVLGEDHPDIALSLNNIGFAYRGLGDHAKALQYLEKALAIRQKVLGEDHPNTVASLNNIAFYTFGESKDYSQPWKQKGKASLENNSNITVNFNPINFTYGKLGKEKKAKTYKKQPKDNNK